jgi:cytochrome c peroxidase
MKKILAPCIFMLTFSLLFQACKDDEDILLPQDTYPGIEAALNIDVQNLPNYALPTLPNYYTGLQTNTPLGNPTTDIGATLGRVLFFDKALSINNTISCASCHQQDNGFTDSALLSVGFNEGLTGAHSMRLGNAAFYTGQNFFWDKRAATLEEQTTMPIQDPVEMGFDQSNGGLDALITKLEQLAYYPELFKLAYGDEKINEDRMQRAMAQFIRSMVSTSSKFDDGFTTAFNPNAPGPGAGVGRDFTNYSAAENRGKQLFLAPPQNGGAGCAGCHQPPTFALAANSRSNGLDAGETTVFKSPSLKNIGMTGPYMHDGSLATLEAVVAHYNNGIENGPALDNRLKDPNGAPLRLNLSANEQSDLVAFLRTLDDAELTTDQKFSDPFK